MAASFRLLTIGPPQLLSAAGEAVRFRTRKHFAILIRLAVELDRPLTRDSLMELLWGDAPAHLARHSLAQALTVLKSKLGHEQVLIRKGTVALADGCIDPDVAHLGACDLEIHGGFLDGFEVPSRAFEEWKEAWHAKLMPKVRDCLVKQMDGGRRIGDFATVEGRAQVLLDLDPLSEDAVRGLMESRAWVGDRSNALKVFTRYEARLVEELGAKPTPDLVRIANLLREGRRATPRGVVDEAPPVSHEKRFESETLIGREREFSVLYDAWLAARQRQPRVMIVTGDPGVGKTTLCNAYASSCQMEGAVVARAQAYEAERELPFAVLAELVKQLTIQRAIGSADPEVLSELSRITSEILAVFPGVPKPVEWTAEVTPLRLADSFLKAIVAAAEETPIVLVVDDIHAVDNASAAILHLVARKLPKLRLVLILTGRRSELRSSAAPAALVTDASIDGLRTVELEPLSHEAAAGLVASLVGAQQGPPMAESMAARILQASNGNPLAIELLTREWQAHGSGSLLQDLERLNTTPAATVGIPRAIRTVFERQIQRLAFSTRAAMDLAAVLGRRLADLSLYAATGLAPSTAGEALTRLLEEGVLREVHGSLEFRNELIRAQAYYAVAGPARQHLHRQVGELLEELQAEDRGALMLEIAWHYLRGGAAKRAWQYAVLGAEAALEVGAPREAEEVLSAALQSEPPETLAFRIRILLAQALLEQSKPDEALVILTSLGIEREPTPSDKANITRMMATAGYLLNNETGLRHFELAERALVAAKETGSVLLVARALFEFARSGAESGEEDRVRTASAQLAELLAQEPNRSIPIIHYAQGYCLYYLYDVSSASLCLRTTVELLRPANKPVELSLAFTGLGNCLRVLCDLDGADRSFDAALTLARKVGNDSRASIIMANMVASLLIRGDFDKAVEVGLQSVEHGRRALSQPMLSGAYMNLAEAYLLAGQPDNAIECRNRAGEWVGQERNWRSRLEFLTEGAGQELMMGNMSSALELISQAERIAEGRERAVPPQSSFEMLRAFRIAHSVDYRSAHAHAEEVAKRLRGRMPIDYLNAISVKAWAEKKMEGKYRPETEEELKLFETLAIPGQKRLLQALGFLS